MLSDARVRVVVADDQPLFREGLVALLATAPNIEVVGTADGGRHVVEVALRTQPQVVLMDLRMPDVDGATATRRLRERAPGIRVLVLTTFEDDASIRDAIDAGAAGYLLKDVSRERLIEAVLAVARGEGPLSDRVGARVVAWAASRDRDGLSERERDVLGRLAQGRSNKEIATELGLSEGTVKNHLTQVFAKLGVDDRVQAVLRAGELGLVPRPKSA